MPTYRGTRAVLTTSIVVKNFKQTSFEPLYCSHPLIVRNEISIVLCNSIHLKSKELMFCLVDIPRVTLFKRCVYSN